MKAFVALLLTVSLAACFPNSAKHRTYAKLGEGAAVAAGIAILYTVNTGADCDEMRSVADETSSSCRGSAQVLGGVGLGLILAGLAGFIATVSTSPEDKPDVPANTLAPTPIDPAATDAPVTNTTTVTPPGSAAK